MTIPQRTAASDLNDILQQLPEAESPVAAVDLITTMLDAGPGVSDLVFSPGRAPQVEKHGELVQVDIPQLPCCARRIPPQWRRTSSAATNRRFAR